MKRKVSRIAAALIIMVMCTVGTATAAFADEAPGIKVPIKISLKGTMPGTPDNFVVKLKADNASYPMPEGSVDGECAVTIRGAGEAAFNITYNKLGVYTYTIEQVAGTNKYCTYDKTKYLLKVYITNAEDGNGFTATTALYSENGTEKVSTAEFSNVYDIPAEPKTGDNSNVLLWAELLIVSGFIIGSLLSSRRKQGE